MDGVVPGIMVMFAGAVISRSPSLYLETASLHLSLEDSQKENLDI